MENITRRRALGDLIALTGFTVAIDCARNPVTGQRQLMLFSEKDEIAIGRDAHPQILSTYGAYKDKNVQEFMDRKGEEIAKISHRKKLKFTFTVLDNAVVNAFAVPGGYVYFNRGIMAYFNDEAQFAGVLGHEIGHITARHSAAQASKAQLASLGLGLGTIFSETFQQYSDFLQLGASLMFLKFSRDDERQADKLGVQYSSEVGYDSQRMSDFFSTLKRLTPSENEALPEWQSTHPDPGNRIQATERETEKLHKANPGKTFSVRRNEYLDMVNGMVYGDDPKNGYVRDGIFYHPGMKFRFPVPKNWRVANQPEDVRLYPDDQRVLIIFTIEAGGSPREAATLFANQNEIYIQNYEDIKVNGMRGIKTLGELPTSPSLLILSYFIQMDKTIFAFHGLAAPFDLDSYDTAFERTAMGFDVLTDPARIDVPVVRIEVRAAQSANTFLATMNGFDIPEKNVKELAILNGMDQNDRVESGVRIKVVDLP
jgi:predicted Zn-dependent protease